MGNWHCPHCRTPQPEAARCWVCRRSSTACAICRHFRRSVAVPYGGVCGMDPHRAPLRGDELRGCWRPIIRSGRAATLGGIAVVDPLGPPLGVPGGLWAEPEA